ncbi:4-hydroxy-tetrahydrodipicolinate synthase [Candidatus Legionella polyplacis]|uniref:4-hydroxy-tetrahydrodipicolinate synthase n=1 Tax=Candidatus Legionella polyplacis TaxID=2005262 RepID=A0ABZ2H0N3_9GAMM
MRFYGNIVALVTPFFQSGLIDISNLCRLVDFHINMGTNVILSPSTTGEYSTLSNEEKILIVRTVVNQVKKRIPVIACAGSDNVNSCINLTLKFIEYGVDAVLISTPSYLKPTQLGLYEYYKYISDNVKNFPIILYNIPNRTSCSLHIKTIEKLIKIPNIIGIKETVINCKKRFKRLVYLCKNENICLYSGNDLVSANWILDGASGVISIASNIVPNTISKMCCFALNLNIKKSLKIHNKLMSLYKLLLIESNPIPVKWVLSKMGLIKNKLRLPMTVLSNKSVKIMEKKIYKFISVNSYY